MKPVVRILPVKADGSLIAANRLRSDGEVSLAEEYPVVY
jgi:hypothetical protein